MLLCADSDRVHGEFVAQPFVDVERFIQRPLCGAWLASQQRLAAHAARQHAICSPLGEYTYDDSCVACARVL
eukprot:5477460-Lingulodinium_polyedra.AAC.1